MAIVYQVGDGRWLVFNNGIKSNYFNTESEANDMASKLTLAEQAQVNDTALAKIGEDLTGIVGTYFTRGYDSGGTNPITNDDLVSLGITAAQLALFITLAEQYANFLGNIAVVPGDYQATLNAIRTDI